MAMGWHLVRVTLGALSPLSCGSGAAGADADVLLVRDPSGLPMIPGSTLQGLLRALHPPGPNRNALFGREEASGNGAAARLMFSHARVHDSKDVAAGFPADLADPLLAALAEEVPLRRDHVKLHHRHAAAEGAKFDRAAVPAGTRFSFEVLMQGEEREKDTLFSALVHLAHPLFRVGGKSRRGYGKVGVCAICHGFFPFERAGDFRALRERPLSDMRGLQEVTLPPAAGVTVITLTLLPEGPWRTGGSGKAVVTSQQVAGTNGDRSIKRRDLAGTAPTREAAVAFGAHGRTLRQPGAEPGEDYVLPGSSIAGPLRHRTVFHWNRLNRRFVDLSAPPEAVETMADGIVPVDRLFGWSRPVAGAANPDGRASALWFEDVRFKPAALLALDNVAIDAFHGGARARLLFDEELVGPDQIKVRITVDRRFVADTDEDKTARKALAFAIRDLLSGRLAIGAKSYGFMTGTLAVEGPDAAVWKAAIDDALTPSREQAA